MASALFEDVLDDDSFLTFLSALAAADGQVRQVLLFWQIPSDIFHGLLAAKLFQISLRKRFSTGY